MKNSNLKSRAFGVRHHISRKANLFRDKGPALFLLIFFSLTASVYAEGLNAPVLCEAIRKAENSPRHPFGIMRSFKHTSPRQACINTVQHKHQDWVDNGSRGLFLTYLAGKFAPLHVKNDPKLLNKYWIQNVEFFLKQVIS